MSIYAGMLSGFADGIIRQKREAMKAESDAQGRWLDHLLKLQEMEIRHSTVCEYCGRKGNRSNCEGCGAPKP